MIEIGSLINIKNKQIEIVKFLGKGKGGYSYLAKDENREFVYKKIHYEPCAHYQFGADKVLGEVEAYKRLANIGIDIPKLLEYSQEENYILKEYIEGDVATQLIADGVLSVENFIPIFNMAQKLYENNTNIDFFPTNFIYSKNKVYYIDYECNDLIEEWDFETWGIYFWLNKLGIKELIEKGSSDKLCLPNSPKPFKTGMENEANELILLYSNKYKNRS